MCHSLHGNVRGRLCGFGDGIQCCQACAVSAFAHVTLPPVLFWFCFGVEGLILCLAWSFLMDKVGLELAVFFCLLPLKFGAYRSCLILVLRCLPLSQPARPDDMQTFEGSPNLCSRALGGVAVSSWVWGWVYICGDSLSFPVEVRLEGNLFSRAGV